MKALLSSSWEFKCNMRDLTFLI